MDPHPLLSSASSQGNPVIEGDVATFIWQGESAPLLVDDLHNWDDSPQNMLRIDSEMWSFSMKVPSDAYMEYAFIDPLTGERLSDPLNSRRVKNGLNAYNNFFYMPQGKPSPLARALRTVPHGSITRHLVLSGDYTAGAMRVIHLYHPPVDHPVPLLVVYDGPDYLRRAKLNVIADNMIARKSIRPIAMAFIQNGGAARTVEYSCSESTLGLVMDCVLPLAKEQIDLEPVNNGGYGIMGSSLGGTMALFTALRLPQVFHNVISQSGAFMAPDYQYVVVDLVKCAPFPDIDIWMDAGRLDWLLEGNRQMVALLKEKNYHVKFHEFSGGHNFTAWRDDISQGLEALYHK